ncbi:hypothetical protein [Paraburkholderia nodosa]|uniref:hypothetical protein n=1 Tax=Paraburkholderia nodosa TaxID=392320 RepID=UPI0004810B77|nr:hypothetical protein [Paraburkholderia nodosa]
MAKLNSSDGSKIDIVALKKAISALESPKTKRARERVALFAELYEIIRDQINEDVSKSTIIKTLANQGMSVSNAVFDKLLADEAKRRGEPVPGKDDDAGEGEPVPLNIAPNAPQAGAKEEVTE